MRTSRALGALAALLLVSILHSAAATAQSNPQAEKLFRDAKALMKEARYGEACDIFAASQRMEPNVGTLMSLADCRDKNGQVATAWGLWVETAAQTRDDPELEGLNVTAKRRATDLEARLSYLTINVADGVRVDGLVVMIDGGVIDPGAWNRTIPVDGGDHVVAAKAPGQEEWSTTVKIPREHGKVSVEVPRFKELRSRPPVVLAPAKEAAIVQAPDDDRKPSRITRRRTIAIGFAAIGVAGLATGGVLGLQALDLADRAKEVCRQDVGCGDRESDLADVYNRDARRRSTIANISFATGGAALVAATLLWVTGAPPDNDPDTTALRIAPQIGNGYAGVEARLRF